MGSFWRNVPHGVRLFRRAPGFVAVVVITIALGIGATTAVFNLADWVLLRPLPGVRDYDRVITIEVRNDADRPIFLSSLNVLDLGARTTALSAVGAWNIQLLQIMNAQQRSVQIFGEIVGGDYFAALGVVPQRGRAITLEETTPGNPAMVAVISDALWRSMFERDPRVIGSTVQVNRHQLTIVGIAPPGYRGAERSGRIDMWVPGSIAAQLRHMPGARALDSRRSPLFGGLGGRLAPGATPATVEAQLADALPRLAAEFPDDNAAFATHRAAVREGVGLSQSARESVGRSLRILGAVVLLVLIIACANVANMLLFRGVGRRAEAAVRRALGATRGRLVRQQLAESLILALAGGVLGVLVALAFTSVFEGTRLQLIELRSVPLDLRVLAFALGVTLLTGLLIGLVPTALSRRLDLPAALKDAAGRDTGARTRVRSAITVLQLSLSLSLLVGALLLTRTLYNYYAIELGFDEGVVSITLDMQPQGYSAERRAAFEAALLEQLRATPEFESAALTVNTPFAGFYASARLLNPQNATDTVSATAEWISDGYFETIGARLVAGRALGNADMRAGGERNVVISEALARHFFGGPPERALGQSVTLVGRGAAPLRVVGVAADKRIRSHAGEPERVIYEAYDAPSRGAQYIMVLVRTPLALRDAEVALRRVVDTLDPALPFMYVERLADKTVRAVAEQQLFARLLVSLAVVALLMAAVGLYAVIAYSVSARTREIGVRMALGADRAHVLRMVLREAGLLAGIGTVLGVIGAVLLSRLIASRLFGVEPLEPAVYLVAVVLFGTIALSAAAFPTRSATRVDPMVALRHE